MILYESEFEEILVNSLKNKFSIDDTSKLIDYLFLRFLILKNISTQKIKDNINNNINFSSFLLEELGINVINNSYFLYKDNYFYMDMKYYDSISNIIDNLLFRYDLNSKTFFFGKELTKKEYIINVFNEIDSTVNKKTLKYKKYKVFKYLFVRECLLYLNELYNVNPKEIEIIENVIQLDELKKNMEDICMIYIDNDEFINKEQYLSEKEVEDFIISNISKIDKDFKLIGRQVKLREGVIDIVCKKDNLIIGIELKVKENDKRLIWQVNYYKDELKKIYNTDNIKILTIAPNYSKSIKSQLFEIKNVDILKYKLFCEGKKITDIKFNKLN